MKNQYFGDFGDYQKFSLLKHLRDLSSFKIIVHWMKTKDDSSNDGSKIKYLSNANEWSIFEPEIFDFLTKHLALNTRDLSLYEKSHHARDINFLSEYIENEDIRQKLLEGIRHANSDLVFFDPDNGIEVKSTNSKNRHKYVTWTDIKTAFDSGKSVLIYQHYSRMNRDKFIAQKLIEFNDRFKEEIFVIKVKHSVYFLMPQEKHKTPISNALKGYSSLWKDTAVVKNHPSISPQRLAELRRTTLIASAGASTRLEGSKLSDKEVEQVANTVFGQK